MPFIAPTWLEVKCFLVKEQHGQEKCTEGKKPIAQGGQALPKQSGQVHMCANGAHKAMHTPTIPVPQG